LAVKRVRVKVGERWYTVEVEEPLGSPAKVTVEGETYLVEVEGTPTRRTPVSPSRVPLQIPSSPPTPPGSVASTQTNGGTISSPMSGKVLAIKVKPGSEVVAGDEVCVVEAMKMEQSIRAPRAGTVKKIYVKPLQQVNIHAPLMELE